MDKKTILINQLQVALANEFIFFTKLCKFHWNVKGPYFGPLHELFKKGYEETFEIADLVAEWIVQLGFHADGTLSEFNHKTILKENVQEHMKADLMIKELHFDIKKIIDYYNELVVFTSQEYIDASTNNFILTLIEKRMKYKWFLLAHIESV